jgi:hypothetical protein
MQLLVGIAEETNFSDSASGRKRSFILVAAQGLWQRRHHYLDQLQQRHVNFYYLYMGEYALGVLNVSQDFLLLSVPAIQRAFRPMAFGLCWIATLRPNE